MPRHFDMDDRAVSLEKPCLTVVENAQTRNSSLGWLNPLSAL